MRNVARCLVGLGVILASGCVVKVNGQVHKFGLDGEEKTEEKKAGDGKGGEINPDELAAQLAAGTTPTGQSVSLKPDFAPNPSVVGTFSSKAEVSVSGQPHGISNCSGYVGDSPAATIKFTSAMKNTRISAPGAGLIVAEFGDRKYICDEGSYDSPPNILLNPEWPAGDDIKIFVGGSHKDETYNYSLKVEDETRPIDILWKGKIKTIDVAEVPKDPIVYSELTAKEAGVKGRCGNSYFRETPDLAFQLKRPLGDISIEVRSAKPIAVQLVGPLTDDGRNIQSRCLNDDDRTQLNRMEAGIYGLRIGTDAPATEVLYHVVFRGKETSRNPVFPPAKFVDVATVDESVITWHFPQLTVSDAENSDANREALFLTAPKPVFVFPKFNMDKSVAEITGGAATGDKAKNEYPQENEPLLLLNKNGYVMAADGAMFRVNMKDLQADPGGNVAVPAAPRNTGLSFDRAVAARGPEDAKAYTAYEKAQKATQTCYDRARSSYEGGSESACGGMEKAEQKAKENLEKELAKNRAARRAASLAKVKPRLETLFKK